MPQSNISTGNPILPGLGVCDPHVRVFDGRVYLYATHDYSPENKRFRMDDWWIWSTDDLVHWRHEYTLRPEQTYLGKPFTDCWATDAALRNDKYYWYFSGGPQEVGVVVGDTPIGPWHDPLGKPLLPRGMTPTEQRDPNILMDDDGAAYIVFGTWQFYIARLGEDMISLAEPPRRITLDFETGPYGDGKTDDKPCLHKFGGRYYLSWGCFYAMADDPYGPYVYQGCLVVPEHTAPEFRFPELTMDRHGSFFEYHNQWYFICNDFSQPGSTGRFRNSILAYVHYRDDGTIAPLRIDGIGVGAYDAAAGPIQAEDYFSLVGGHVRERAEGGFEVQELGEGSCLLFPNVAHVPLPGKLILCLANGSSRDGEVEVRAGHAEGTLLGKANIPPTGAWDAYRDIEVSLDTTEATVDLAFVFHGPEGEIARLDSWRSI